MKKAKENKKFTLGIYKKLSILTDKRRAQGKRHSIELAVSIMLLAIISGYHGYRPTGDFIEKNKKELIELFGVEKRGLPSVSTIRRIIINIDFKELELIFEEWTIEKIRIKPGTCISIDGKAIKGTIPEEVHKFVTLVSLYLVEEKVVLTVGKVNEKSNEIPMVRKLIKKTRLADVIFRIDALHCQKETAKLIIDTGNDYVLEVKRNQKMLFLKIKSITENSSAIDENTTKEKNRGRFETRESKVYDLNLNLENYGWSGVKRIVKVTRKTRKNGKTTKETAYFIASLKKTAREFNEIIRGHWGIENSLHYVKDVTMKEDSLRIRTGNAPQNMSILRNFVLNVIRLNGNSKVAKTIRLVSSDFPKIVKMFKIKSNLTL